MVYIPGWASSNEEQIMSLIDAIETSGCEFIRNDTRHDAEEAADHLRLKYRRGKRYASTPESFIENLASKSSLSGKPYSIACDDGTSTSAEWLTNELESIRAKAAGGNN